MSNKSILEIIEEKAVKYKTDNDLTGAVDLEIDLTEREFNVFMSACREEFLDNGITTITDEDVDINNIDFSVIKNRKGTLHVKHNPNAVEGELVIRKSNR